MELQEIAVLIIACILIVGIIMLPKDWVDLSGEIYTGTYCRCNNSIYKCVKQHTHQSLDAALFGGCTHPEYTRVFWKRII